MLRMMATRTLRASGALRAVNCGGFGVRSSPRLTAASSPGIRCLRFSSAWQGRRDDDDDAVALEEGQWETGLSGAGHSPSILSSAGALVLASGERVAGTAAAAGSKASVAAAAVKAKCATGSVVAASAAAAAPSVPPAVASFLAVFPPACFFFLQTSPLKTVKEIQQRGSVGDLPALPFVSLALNCTIWSTYGAMVQDMTVFAPNFTGLLCGLYYTQQYHKFADDGQKPMALYGISAATIAGVAGVVLTLPFDTAAHYVGLTGCTVAVILMASPLAALKTIIKEKSTASMPFLTSVAVFFNAAAWSSYGYFVAHNPLIWGPNVLGLGAATAQLALFAIYPSKPKAVE